MSMIHYKHKQIGYPMIVLFVILLAVTIGLVYNEANLDIRVYYFLIFVLFILSGFFSLRVIIEDAYIRLKFWYWLFRKEIPISKIDQFRIVENPWYIWWWIRFTISPYTLIFSVSWFDAIEILQKDWKIYRIGTDEPYELFKSIEKAIEYEKLFDKR